MSARERETKYTIAVRALCDFTAKAGDLDLRFTPSPSAREGMEGHALIARRRGPGYETEIALSGDFADLRVRGRADGYDPVTRRLEEFKTHRGDLSRVPASHRAVHRAQLLIYGALLCRTRQLPALRLSLVYLNVASGHETAIEETMTAAQLEEVFAGHCCRFLRWAQQELAHRVSRDASLRTVAFPFPTFNGRQRELARGVYRSVRDGRALLTQAPTGCGKTVGTLFPALKALPEAGVDKLFYLVAKTSGRTVALDALARIAPADLRVIELVARDKVCENPGAECNGLSCPLARGFYDRLPAAREEAVGTALLDRGAVRAIGLRHGICPYYLAQELVRWADVVVGDYNYYFDVNAILYLLTSMNQWSVTLLVDEAHNLVERARSMFTAQLRRDSMEAARRVAPAPTREVFSRLARRWDEIERSLGESAYTVLEESPEPLQRAMEDCIAAISDYSAERSDGVPPETLSFYFEALHFSRLTTTLDRDSVCDVTRDPGTAIERGGNGDCALSLRNVVPAKFTSERLRAAKSCVLFSATLAPFQFYRDVLGLPQDCVTLEVGSPFRPDQLAVKIVRSISTRLRNRKRSVRPIARLIQEQYRAQPGNYLAFFSSYEYLNDVAGELTRTATDIDIWHQEPGMSESRRDEFLARFRPEGRGVGFAVLGGAFAEGVDLPGGRLIGAFVTTLGLPQVNPVNLEMQRRIETRFGAGYAYTFLIPGLRKVIQAAGRVIRTPTDAGVVYLIDDRFADPTVRRLLPAWWVVKDAASAPATKTVEVGLPR
ncbi:MAG TPA: ATP-dependent DNA helicase [Steroidobacteraceae bacterium]|jgi:Rad3-related DNA helicase